MRADNIRVPALIVTILSWAVVACNWTAALLQTIWLVSYTQGMATKIILTIAGVASSFGQLAYLPSIVAVIVWIHVAHSNLHRAGLPGLNYSPVWAWASFFVPVANLFVPLRAMRELANRSAGEPEELA